MAVGKTKEPSGTGEATGNRRLKRPTKPAKARRSRPKEKPAAGMVPESYDKVAHAGKRTVNRDNK